MFLVDLHLQLQVDTLAGAEIDDLSDGHEAGRGDE
jgi:hypothetical protein